MFDYMFVCLFAAKTPLYPGSSLTSLEQFLRAIGEAVSQAIVLSKIPKENITCNL